MDDFEYPLVGFHFFVEVQGKLVGAFREVSGLNSESEVVEYKSSGPKGDLKVRTIPGRPKGAVITCKRGVTKNKDMWTWRKEIEDGKFESARKNGSIVMYDQQHTEVARWNFTNAWPSKVEGPSLNAGNNEVAIESITLQAEELKLA